MRKATVGLWALLAAVLGSGPALADAPSECSTWFPDLSCDRPQRFAGFQAPSSAPYLFEDPFITTGVSAWYIWHDFPESGVFQGGDVSAFAVQVRVALTDRLGFVASKDGRITLRPDNDLLDTETGYGDLGAGLKYALIDDPENRRILTPSLRYEFTNGSRDVLMGNGEGVWIPGLSGGLGLGDYHLLGSVAARLPVDGDAESTVLTYGVHVDRELRKGLAPFVEILGHHYLDDGDGTNLVKLGSGAQLPISAVQAALGLSPFDGYDVANMGSDGVEGNDVMSWAVGFRAQILENVSLSLSYERPLLKRRDITKQRVTLNLLLER